MEQVDYNLLFRWFVGLNMDDGIWEVTVFTKNRERWLDGDIAEAFFEAVLQQARERSLLSDGHFTMDGTLLEAWASVKSYQRKDGKNAVPPDDPGNATVDFHGEKRSNQTHASKTDPDAKMVRKGKEAQLNRKDPCAGELHRSFASLRMTVAKGLSYAVFCIFSMASSMPRVISSMDRSLVCVAIDHLWPKGSLSLP